MHKKERPKDNPDARMRLIRAAVDLFAEKGYASTPVREIVERAGVTKPVLYYYFKNKEGLFVAILDWASELQEDLLKKLFESSDNTLARFIDLYREIYKELRERGNLFKMINNFVFGPPQGIPVSLFDRFHRKMVEAIKMIYEKGLAKNEVRREDPEDVALVVLGLLNTSLHLDNLFPEMEDPERPGRLLTMAFNGLAVPRSP